MSWLIEEFFSDSWGRERPEQKLERQSAEPLSATVSTTGSPRKKHDDQGSYAKWIIVSTTRIALFHWFAALAEFVHMLASSRKYDYWVGCALGEDDARKKVKYLSKALALNPGYAPGWGLKANALLALQRYDEAMECVEKILGMAPNPLAWYEKGLCCYHLGRFQEAVQCFDKALANRLDKNSKLREDTLHHRKLAVAQMNQKELA